VFVTHAKSGIPQQITQLSWQQFETRLWRAETVTLGDNKKNSLLHTDPVPLAVY